MHQHPAVCEGTLLFSGPDVYYLDESAVKKLGGVQYGVKDRTGEDYYTTFRNITSREHALEVIREINTMLIDARKEQLSSYIYNNCQHTL